MLLRRQIPILVLSLFSLALPAHARMEMAPVASQFDDEPVDWFSGSAKLNAPDKDSYDSVFNDCDELLETIEQFKLTSELNAKLAAAMKKLNLARPPEKQFSANVLRIIEERSSDAKRDQLEPQEKYDKYCRFHAVALADPCVDNWFDRRIFRGEKKDGRLVYGDFSVHLTLQKDGTDGDQCKLAIIRRCVRLIALKNRLENILGEFPYLSRKEAERFAEDFRGLYKDSSDLLEMSCVEEAISPKPVNEADSNPPKKP